MLRSSGSRTRDGRRHLHDHVASDVLQMRSVGKFHVMDAAVDAVDDQIDLLVHLIAGQPFGQDATCDFLARPGTVTDVLIDAAFFIKPVSCERSVHGLDDIIAIGKLLQGDLGAVGDSPLPSLDLIRQSIALQVLDPRNHEPAVLTKRIGRSSSWPQVNNSSLALFGGEHLVEPGPPLRLNLRLQFGLKLDLALVSEFQRHQLGSPMTDAVGDIVSGDIEDTASIQDTADDDVGMRMAGVVMIDRDPIEARLEVLLHLPHEVARETSEIGHFVGIFRRHNEAELMPVLTSPLDECLAISLVLKGRIGLSFLAVAVDSIPLEVAKMGIDCLARRLGPLRTMQCPFPSLVH